MTVSPFPYAGSSGWSGSTTSQDRAASDDASGRTTARQATILDYVRSQGTRGATWREVDTALGIDHHGRTSGALSVLHLRGDLVRIATTRGRCQVYLDGRLRDRVDPDLLRSHRAQAVTPAERFARAFAVYADTRSPADWDAAIVEFRRWRNG